MDIMTTGSAATIYTALKGIFELGLISAKTIYRNWVRAYNPEKGRKKDNNIK